MGTINDTHVHNVTASASYTFEEILTEICRQETVTENNVTVRKNVYTYLDTWNISIAAGYNPTLTRRWGGIKCNLSIIGKGSVKSKIYIAKTAISQTTAGDSFLAIEGMSVSERVSVHFENVEFMPLGAEPGKPFTSSPATDIPVGQYAHIVKIYFAKKVVFYKVTSTLENGFVSNLDLRTCDNIFIRSCSFTNNNGAQEGNTEGAILMVRGLMDNVNIINNTFTKYGNDELIGIFSGAVPEPSLENGVPPYERDRVLRRNIRVTGNTFTYRRPVYGPNNSALRPSKPIDTLITFYGVENTYWENVLFAHNTINCNDVARRVVFVQRANYVRESLAFRIFGNKITHNYTNTVEGNFILDFCITGDSAGYVPKEMIEIAHNQIYANETIGKSTHGHVNVMVEGAAVNVHHNLFDGTKFRTVNPNSWQVSGMVPLLVQHYSSEIKFSENKCLKTGLLGWIWQNPSTEPITVDISGNYVEGSSQINYSDSSVAHLRLENNYFKTNSYILMVQESTTAGGSLWASNNVWDTVMYSSSSSDSAVVYASYSSTTYKSDRVTFISNVITGVRKLTTINLPPSDSTTVAANTIIT